MSQFPWVDFVTIETFMLSVTFAYRDLVTHVHRTIIHDAVESCKLSFIISESSVILFIIAIYNATYYCNLSPFLKFNSYSSSKLVNLWEFL